MQETTHPINVQIEKKNLKVFENEFSIKISQKQIKKSLGPASTEVEHLPRNFRPQGDRGSNLAEDFSFQT